MSLKIDKLADGKNIILKIEGVLDISTINLIEPYFDELENINTLILDLSSLEFIDSTGIGSIINAIYLSQEKNFQVKLQGINEITEQIFETVGLYQILETMQGEAQ